MVQPPGAARRAAGRDWETGGPCSRRSMRQELFLPGGHPLLPGRAGRPPAMIGPQRLSTGPGLAIALRAKRRRGPLQPAPRPPWKVVRSARRCVRHFRRPNRRQRPWPRSPPRPGAESSSGSTRGRRGQSIELPGHLVTKRVPLVRRSQRQGQDCPPSCQGPRPGR